MRLRAVLFLLLVGLLIGLLIDAPLVQAEPEILDFVPAQKPGFGDTPEAKAYDTICPSVHMISSKDFKFKDMETRLLCGDSQNDLVGKPWQLIPPTQSAYFLRGFLQARGYHEPEFIQDGDVLYVRSGPESHLERFRVAGGPSTWDPPRRRLVEGAPLTPPLLDDLQGWALTQIKNEGYACATGSTRADPKTGEALVTLAPNKIRYINGFNETGDMGLAPGVLDRYDAFEVGGLYRDYLIALTRKRTQDDGFLQTYLMTTRCDPEGVTIVRDVVLGPSRTVRLGVGATTDVGAKALATIRENRIGSSASSAQARINVSYLDDIVNRQTVDAHYQWYYSQTNSRAYIEPSVTYDHDAEIAFDNRTQEARLTHGWTHELSAGQIEVRMAPVFLDSKMARGIGPSDVTMTYLDFDFRWTSHEYEYFSTSPRTGENFQTALYLATKGAGAEFTAQKIQVQGEKLWSIFRYDPPLLILATRFNLASIFAPNGDITSELPNRFLTFLGGDQDLRGFDQTSLPRSGTGALSGATVSGEARLHKVIFKVADAFTFLDTGLFGMQSFSLRIPYLMSPGVGVRYESPIGVFRLYVAERFALVEEAGSVPYGSAYRVGITFGQEF